MLRSCHAFVSSQFQSRKLAMYFNVLLSCGYGMFLNYSMKYWLIHRYSYRLAGCSPYITGQQNSLTQLTKLLIILPQFLAHCLRCEVRKKRPRIYSQNGSSEINLTDITCNTRNQNLRNSAGLLEKKISDT